ncbi:hypothetical protein N1851_033764 [Merluccius polli]|uniref:SCAN box domain-containing protein n=1 Tax=Merluccius polli TaxID=89951 RepID=A0AA47NNB8_MERPO|nr:hypothetical protein N1851_033764 [Merluccius polli]
MVTLEEFVAAPSERLLVELTKEQLWKVADNYRIELPSVLKSAKKKNLVGFIREFLKEKQILPVLTPINPGSETQADIVANMLGPTTESESSDLTFEQQRELLKLQMDMALEKRKLELELKQLEAQEKEKDRWLEMEKLKHQEQEREVERTRLRLLAEGKVDRNKSSGKSDLAGMIKFLPKFNERDPDIFFSLFENIAAGRNWDDEDKTILLQTVLVGRVQEAFVALTPADRKVYDIVKQAVLKCYELIPEAYRQRFRDWRKGEEQTHTEVARELSSFFNRWLAAEGFKNILPERITVYVNEHEVKTVAEAAVLADG